MAGFPEPEGAVLTHNWHSGNVRERNICLCHNEIQLSNELCAGNELRHKRPQELCKFIEDLCDLAGFGKVEFGYLVLQRNNLRGLHEGGLSSCAFVVDKALEGSFFGR